MGKKRKSLDFDDFELDPTLPLPAGTGIWPVKQGQGKEILENATPRVVELSYRAFYMLWEVAENRAAQQYQRYVGGPLDAQAQTVLEACKAFREAVHETQFPNLSEDDAQKMRARLAKVAKKKADEDAVKLAKARAAKKGEPVPTEDVDSDISTPDCPKCGKAGSGTPRKSKKTGAKIWKCADCGNRWPREEPGEASTRPSKALKPPKTGKDSSKKKKASQKPTEASSKRRQKK